MGWALELVSLGGMVREGWAEKVIFEHRPDGSVSAS